MRRSLFSSLAACLAMAAAATMVAPQQIPTERLLRNAIEFVQKNPKDPDAHYALGRLRYVIYCADDPRALAMYSEAPPFRFPFAHTSHWEFQNRTLKSDPATCQLVRDAISELRMAIRLDKGRAPGMYHLTLACVYEASAPIAPKISPRATPKGWLEEAYRQYKGALDDARESDLKRGYQSMMGTYETWVSVEAGEGMVRLQPEAKATKDAQEHLAQMKKLPQGPITPIVFSLNGSSSLGELLDPQKTVDFNLDGTGAPQKWPWVRPETAILVWQPETSVPITSGRQLFGSATWWMMYRDGYAALAALDNDGNGWLEGKELSGLAVWRDRNGDGRSDPGEVVPVGACGISGIATKSTGRTGMSLVSAAGIRLRDGRVLPSYDWVVEPASQ